MADRFKKKCFTIYGEKITISKVVYNIIATTVKRYNVYIAGWGCGYVIVNQNHPAFGREYLENVDVHGGITYSRELNDEKFNGIYVRHGWVFGFDTGNYDGSRTCWTKRQVIAETLSLAKQLEKYGEIF